MSTAVARAGVFAVAALILAVVILAARAWVSDEAPQPAGVIGEDAVAARLAGVRVDGETIGRDDAPVRITEFVDLQCASCGYFSRTQLSTVIDELVRPGRAQLRRQVVAVTAPRDRTAQTALIAQALVAQNRFWAFTELWLENLPAVEGQDVARAAGPILVGAKVTRRQLEDALSRPRDLTADIDRARSDLDAAGGRRLPVVVVSRPGAPRVVLQSPTAQQVISAAGGAQR